MRFGDFRYSHVDKAVDICNSEEFTRELEKMVEAMKGAVAMHIMMLRPCQCAVSLYYRNEATRKARLKLSAITMSSEQSRTRPTGDSVWLGFERYAALFEHGTRRVFAFYSHPYHLTLHTSVRKLALLIARNASSVECLLIGFGSKYMAYGSFRQLFSLDIWKEAFPSLQGAYLILDTLFTIDVSPHLMKYVRGVAYGDERINQGYLNWISSMVRNEDNLLEEINFPPTLLDQAELLDETLRSVRSFEVDIESMTGWDLLVMSFERTKAEGDKLERLSVSVFGDSFSATALETIIRSRPNLQVLNVDSSAAPHFLAVCQAVASSTLIAFKCKFYGLRLPVEAAVATVGQLLQHSTIRDLQLVFNDADDHFDDFVEGVAEGLRATRLRRFHLAMPSLQGVSIGSMTKLYESVRENRSLMDIQLEGPFWYPWRFQCHHDLPHAPPCPFSFFEFLSSRNQYLSQLFLPHESTLPAGLWPLVLESASSDASILYYLLSFQPHLVKGRIEGNVVADRERGVDGPARKCRSIA